MALVQPVKITTSGLGEVLQWSWTLANGDYGAPIGVPNNYDATIHVYGTFGVGGSVTYYGSNNAIDFNSGTTQGGSWVPLADPQGSAITKNALSIETILEQTAYQGPRCTAGDGTTSIVINVIYRRKN